MQNHPTEVWVHPQFFAVLPGNASPGPTPKAGSHIETSRVALEPLGKKTMGGEDMGHTNVQRKRISRSWARTTIIVN